jgi:hypothetical protein
MPIKNSFLRHLTFLVFFLLIGIVIAGCKGKEEVQAPDQPPVNVQQDAQEVGAPPAQDDLSPEETRASLYEQVGNTPPRITSLNVSPTHPVPGDTIQVEIGTHDREGDEVTVLYEWTKNEVTDLGNLPTVSLKGDKFARGDQITLKATPDDGTLKGTPVNSFVVIANSSPVITPSPDTFKFDGDTYEYQVNATDPDGDVLTYSLSKSPEGMTINPSTGLITWNIPPGYTGKSPVTVSVKDSQGGEVMQNFTLEIRPE